VKSRHSVQCKALSKQYVGENGSKVQALRSIDLDVAEGEFLSIVGYSGSGKSTLLRILAGLEEPSSGVVVKNSEAGVGFLFQNDSIFPWRTVAGNLSYSMEARGIAPEIRITKVDQLCRAVGLPIAYLNKYPRELSGGEARRVSIGMVLSSDASLILLDEPTSQLDYVSRIQLQELVRQVWNAMRPTIVCVTHDIDEAILLSQRIVVLDTGEIRDMIPVFLPFPRDHAALASEVGSTIRTRILAGFGPRQ
jgi:NitT/TauT family transport system ATP-binding protein